MLYKKAVLIFTGEQLLESLFSKVPGQKEIPTRVLSYAYCECLNNIYFQKHLRAAVSDYSFTIVLYSFSAVSLQLTIILYGEECSLKLHYVIQ